MVPPKDEQTKIDKITVSALNVLLVIEKMHINKILMARMYKLNDIGTKKRCLSRKK